jgi:hypothetical protein
MDCFGFDRVIFGGDWPVSTLGDRLSRAGSTRWTTRSKAPRPTSCTSSTCATPRHFTGLSKDGRLFGVLDLDSPNLARFDADDAAGLQAMVKLLLDGSDLSRLAD